MHRHVITNSPYANIWLRSNTLDLPRELSSVLHDALVSPPPPPAPPAAVIYLEIMRSNFLHAADPKSPESCLHQMFFPASDAFGHSIISYTMHNAHQERQKLSKTRKDKNYYEIVFVEPAPPLHSSQGHFI